MVTKTKLRNAVRDGIKKSDPDKTYTKDWEMSLFRHQLMKVAEFCPGVQAFIYKINLENQLSICDIFYRTCTFVCSYDYKKKIVVVSKLDDVGQCISSEIITVDMLFYYIKANQPKVKVVIRKK